MIKYTSKESRSFSHTNRKFPLTSSYRQVADCLTPGYSPMRLFIWKCVSCPRLNYWCFASLTSDGLLCAAPQPVIRGTPLKHGGPI